MTKKYSTLLLYGCVVDNFKEEQLTKMHTALKNSLKLLSIVIKEINKTENLSEDAKKSMKEFNSIANYNENNLKILSDDIWSIEELTLLIIMMKTNRLKLYNAMSKATNTYLLEHNIPSLKIIRNYQDWLRDAYNYIYKIQFCNWTEDIDLDNLLQITEELKKAKHLRNQITEIEITIKEKEILKDKEDSIIGSILMKCAYPELLKIDQDSITNKMLSAFGEVVESIEKIESSNSQVIAINEFIKSLNKSKEDTTSFYKESELKISNDIEIDKAVNFIIKKLKKNFSLELDSIEKNTP